MYALVLAFIMTLLVHVGSGPHWDYVHQMRQGCRRDWWSHMLYVNNYLPLNNYRFLMDASYCMNETWYLACDMQLFIFSPLLIYPLWKSKWTGLAWNLAVMSVSLVLNAAAYISWDLAPSMLCTRRY